VVKGSYHSFVMVVARHRRVVLKYTILLPQYSELYCAFTMVFHGRNVIIFH
jgi:hypothetical protein